jgi:hypothetical protein
VQLWLNSEPSGGLPAEHVKRLEFSNLRTIPAQLKFARTDSPSDGSDKESKLEEETSQVALQACIQAAERIQRAWRTYRGNSREKQVSPAGGDEEDAEMGHNRAAVVIQHAWAAWRRRVPKHPVDAARFRWIKACQQEAKTIPWGEHHVQRAAFLVHLPRVLNCLDWLLKTARGEQDRIKQTRVGAPPEEQVKFMESFVDMK